MRVSADPLQHIYRKCAVRISSLQSLAVNHQPVLQAAVANISSNTKGLGAGKPCECILLVETSWEHTGSILY